MPRKEVVDSGVTPEQIVSAALALLREGGLRAVSMRAVGTRLGIAAPSLYWHVKNKEDLYRLMSEAIFDACLDAMPRCRDWRHWLREFGLALWRAQHATPDIRTLIVAAPADKKHIAASSARVVAKLGELGLSAQIAGVAQQSVQALVTGWTTLRKRPGVTVLEEPFRESLEVLIAGWESRAQCRGQ